MMPHPLRTLAANAVLALLVAPLASAEGPLASGQVVARSLQLDGGTAQTGSFTFLHVTQDQAAPATRLAVAGRHIDGVQYDEQGVEANAGTVSFSTLRALSQVHPNPGHAVAADQARAVLAGAPGSYLLNVFADRAAPFQATFPAGKQSVLQHPQLTRLGIQEAGNSGAPVTVPLPIPVTSVGRGDPDSYWTPRTAGTAHVLTEASGTGLLHLEGSFTLEVIGLDVHLTGRGVDQSLHSGTTRSPPAPGAPGAVQTIQQSFLRLTVSDGSLDLGVQGATLAQWSGTASNIASGAASMDDATGSLTLASGQQQRLTGAAYRLDGPAEFQATPSQQGLQLAITGLDAGGQPVLPASLAVRQAATPLSWAIAAAVAGTAGAALLALRLRRQPGMADLEVALESGRFRRAAREARRLLRRRPSFEDAVLGRAIALSKLGRDRRVVREIQAHLDLHEPSDGVLHYVLGVALSKTGAMAAAHAAWKEALRRTPALLPHVQPFLLGQQPSSPPSPVAPVVDGTAYA